MEEKSINRGGPRASENTFNFLRRIANVELKELFGNKFVNGKEYCYTFLQGYIIIGTNQNVVDYMFECTLGRKFAKCEEVIHLDGDKLNIDPDNLRIFCKQEWEKEEEFRVRYLQLCRARTIVQKKLAHGMPYWIVREQTIAMLHVRFPDLLLYEVLPAKGNFSVTRTTWDKG